MPTQEDRLDRLEMKVASLELEHLYEQRKAAESLPSEQALDLKDVNHNTTMLLGIASGQERAIKTIQADVESIKNRVEQIDANVISLSVKVDKRFVALEENFDKRFVALEENFDKRFVALEENFDKRFVALEENFDKRFVALEGRITSLEQRFDALEQRFTILEGKVDQIFQILTRLSER